MRIALNDIEINLTSGFIIKQDETFSVRAKTLLVLKHLIAHKERVVTKDELLSTIWHDVIVQEQVLVQSIKEIRQLLGSEVIKTYPRQGYQWAIDVTEINDLTAPIFNRYSAYLMSTVAFISVIVLSIITWLMFNALSEQDQKSSLASRFSVMFLPVENDMPDNIHDWVPLEGMQYLSHSLKQNAFFKVLEKDLLLDTLQSKDKQSANMQSIAPFASIISQQKITDLQEKLDADLIVQTRLVGYPQDFQLQYTLYQKHNVERGVVFSNTVENTFDQLLAVISQRYNDNNSVNDIEITSYSRDFSNEAFARGLELYHHREYQKAIPFFTSSLQENPELMSSRRLLAASYVNSANVTKGIALMQENIEQAKIRKDHREEIRSNLMLGVLLINWQSEALTEVGSLLEAEKYVSVALYLAIEYQDKLFTAYAYEELGKIKRLQKNYQQAIEYQHQALSYHQAFRGDYGQTTALIELARVAAAQEEFNQADELFTKALDIAIKNGVNTNHVAILLAQADIEQIKGNIEQAKNFAKQAMRLAEQSKSDYLIARVAAWLNNNDHYEIN